MKLLQRLITRWKKPAAVPVQKTEAEALADHWETMKNPVMESGIWMPAKHNPVVEQAKVIFRQRRDEKQGRK